MKFVGSSTAAFQLGRRSIPSQPLNFTPDIPRLPPAAHPVDRQYQREYDQGRRGLLKSRQPGRVEPHPRRDGDRPPAPPEVGFQNGFQLP